MAKINKKLLRVLDEIQKTEEKIAEWQKHLDELNIQREQLENMEIVKSIRSVKMESRELLSVLLNIQDGVIALPTDKKAPENTSENEELERPDISEESTAALTGISEEPLLEKEMIENESKN